MLHSGYTVEQTASFTGTGFLEVPVETKISRARLRPNKIFHNWGTISKHCILLQRPPPPIRTRGGGNTTHLLQRERETRHERIAA